MWWTVTIPSSCDICIQWERLKKSGVWVLHALSQNHKNQWLTICASLLACHRLTREQHRPFLSCIVNGDEKWCLYANMRKRKECLSPNKRKMSEMFQFLHLALHFLYMLRRHIILLITIRPSDGDVKPCGPFGAFREEQAMSRHRVSPSLFLSSSTTQTATHTVTLTATSYRYSSHR